MNISTNYSPMFGTSLLVNKTNMTNRQIANSEKISDYLDYSEAFQDHRDDDVDIFILPKGEKGANVEVRFADPISGKFYRHDGKIVRYTYGNFNGVSAAEEINSTLADIETGKIKRPKINMKKVFDGKSEVCRIKPDYQDGLVEYKNDLLEIMNEKMAQKQAVLVYTHACNNGSMDEDF